MKEILYMPSGKYFRFYDFSSTDRLNRPMYGIEAFSKSIEAVEENSTHINVIFKNILNYYYKNELYDLAEIPLTGIIPEEFELIEVDDA